MENITEIPDKDFEVFIKGGEIWKAISKFQGKCEHPKKTASNPFYKSKYATLDVCISANQKLLAECELAVLQFPVASDGKVGVITILSHSGGEYFKIKYLVKPDKDNAQALGSAITYLRRYAYCAVLGIAGEDDDDGNSASGKTDQKRTNTKPDKKEQHTKDQVKDLLKNASSVENVLALWTELSVKQQADSEIKNWFSMRKEQLK